MRGSLLSILIAVCMMVQAQQPGMVRGRFIDTSARQPLSDGTISLLLAADSSLLSFTVTDKKGYFELKQLEHGNYILLGSFEGYEQLRKAIAITRDKSNVDLKEIPVQKEYQTLPTVVIEEAPVRVRDDTIFFRADAFKTKPNATVEDLLKKLPGIQVEKDGAVSAMGENVQKVYVDGKEFFGSDPKLATKNITADMVDQVQVFDDMSEQAKFTKIDDGSRSKTINIRLKKDRKKGDFGKITVGAGNEKRYEGNLSFNHFRGDQRVSVLAAANNTNNQGFSFSDIISNMAGMPGGFGMMKIGAQGGMGNFGNGSGISTNRSAGINYNDVWGTRVDFRSSYHFSQNNNLLRQSSYRQSSFPGDSTTETYSEIHSRNNNKNHRFNARWEYAVDSMNSFLYTTNLTVQRSDGNSNDTSSTYSKGLSDYLAITSRTFNRNTRDGLIYSGELLYRKKFRRAGRTLTLGWRNSFGETESESFNQSPFVFYKPDGGPANSQDQDYVSGQATRTNNNTLSVSYTEPLARNKIVEFNYAYSRSSNTSDKRTYDYNLVTGKYDMLNLPLTNYFHNTNRSNRFGANFRVQEKKLNYQFGVAVQRAELTSHSIHAAGSDSMIRQSFMDFFPSASLNLSPAKTKHFSLNYRGRTNAPSISQLQDVPDVSNPLQVRTGNPSLKQEFSNQFNIHYNTFNLPSLRFFVANFSVNITSNKIANSLDSLSKTVTISRPVNMDGAFNSNAFFSLGFPVKKIKGSNLNFTTMGSYGRDVSELYKQKNFTHRWMVSQSIHINYHSKEVFNMGISASINYNKTFYEVQENLNNEYFAQSYSADFSYIFKPAIILITDLDYYISSGRSAGFNQSYPTWNASLSKQFLKNKAAELRISIFDILGQNKSVNRSIGDNYFEDTRSNVLGRYFLISFIYSLNKMGKNQSQMPMHMEKMIERQIRH